MESAPARETASGMPAPKMAKQIDTATIMVAHTRGDRLNAKMNLLWPIR